MGGTEGVLIAAPSTSSPASSSSGAATAIGAAGAEGGARLLNEIYESSHQCIAATPAGVAAPPPPHCGPSLESSISCRGVLIQTKGALGLLERMKQNSFHRASEGAGGPPYRAGPGQSGTHESTCSVKCELSAAPAGSQQSSATHKTAGVQDRASGGPLYNLDFPSGLLLSSEEYVESVAASGNLSRGGSSSSLCLLARPQVLPASGGREMSGEAASGGGGGTKRCSSVEGMPNLRVHYEHRVRHDREGCQRRRSFNAASGLAGGETRSLLEELEASSASAPSSDAQPLFRRHCSFTPYTTGSAERFPDRICAYLTNGQRVTSRLKMFQHFAAVAQILNRPKPASSGLKLLCGAWSIAKPGKPFGGEDAYFHNEAHHNFSFAGVADGVGEWGEYDCCPKQFAVELMQGSKQFAEKLPYVAHGTSSGINGAPVRASRRALEVLRAGFERAHQAKDCFGSSTSLVAGLDEAGEMLGIACLGDSSTIVLRRTQPLFRHMTIAKRTREQQHFFNCPYQLSRLPNLQDLPTLEQRGLYKLISVIRSLSPSAGSDSPDQADLIDLKVKEGDLIILGTDGLFDNLFDNEIISLASLSLSPYESDLFVRYSSDKRVAQLTQEWVKGNLPHPMALEPPTCDPDYGICTSPQAVARGIAEAAFYRSVDGRARTPFAKAARAAGASAAGGKQDDITVVACWVVASDKSSRD